MELTRKQKAIAARIQQDIQRDRARRANKQPATPLDKDALRNCLRTFASMGCADLTIREFQDFGLAQSESEIESIIKSLVAAGATKRGHFFDIRGIDFSKL